MQRIDIYWRDIPAQVQIKRGRERGKYLLSHRFQAAIDRAAMRAGKGGSDAYLEEWRRVTTQIEMEGSSQQVAEECGMALENAYSDDDIARLVAQKGFDEVPQ
ncbi:MAG: virulence factor [Luminiphilus sp.]|nr:virulence factor [Luminiphilus sp.]